MHKRNWAILFAALILTSCSAESKVASDVTSAIEVSAPSKETSCKDGGNCELGDTGPGGGIIVYVDESGFHSDCTSDQCLSVHCHLFDEERCRYLEAAPEDLPGEYNFWQAPLEAATYVTPTANDWELPSMGALEEMCNYATQLYLTWLPDSGMSWNKCGQSDTDYVNNFSSLIGGFQTTSYWSSSHLYGLDYPYYDAWSLHFGSTKPDDDGMYYHRRVRPVRAF